MLLTAVVATPFSMNTYVNPARPIEAHMDNPLSRMKLEKKIAQMHAVWLFLAEDRGHEVRSHRFTGISDADSINVMLRSGLGQITRPLGTRTLDPRQVLRALNCLQKLLIEETRFGIPVIAHEECLSGLMAQNACPSVRVGVLRLYWMWHVMRVGAGRRAPWVKTLTLTGVLATKYVQGLQGDDRQARQDDIADRADRQ